MCRISKSLKMAALAFLGAIPVASADVDIDREDRIVTIIADDSSNRIEVQTIDGRLEIFVERFVDGYGIGSSPDDIVDADYRLDRVDAVEIYVGCDEESNTFFDCELPVSVNLGDARSNNVTVVNSPNVLIVGGDGHDDARAINCHTVDITLNDSWMGHHDYDSVEVFNANQATINGGPGSDYIYCGFPEEWAEYFDPAYAGLYVVDGGDGDDDIVGLETRTNSLSQMHFGGGRGDDRLFGGQTCLNILDGGNDDDILFGGDDWDWINGGAGNDVLCGSRFIGLNEYGLPDYESQIASNDDVADTMIGGTGADEFYARYVSVRTELVREKRTRRYYDFKTRTFKIQTYYVYVRKTVQDEVARESVYDFNPLEGDSIETTVVN